MTLKIQNITKDLDRLIFGECDALIHADGAIFFRATDMDIDVERSRWRELQDRPAIAALSYTHKGEMYIDSRVGVEITKDVEEKQEIREAAYDLRLAATEWRHLFQEEN